MTNYKWGIIGPGRIAVNFCEQFPAGQTLYGVASAHSQEKAAALASQFKIPHVYSSHEELLADPAIEVVYIATTNNVHYDNIKAALLAGKHVLAEKPITLNASQLVELNTLAQSKHLILMEAQTIYHMPLYPKLLEFVAQHPAQVGRLKSLQAALGMFVDPNETAGRLLNPELAGGALLDLGIYTLSFARRFMTATPKLEKTVMVPTATGVDDTSVTLLSNSHQELGSFSLSLSARQPEVGYAVYEHGYFMVEHFLRPERAIFVDGATGKQQVITAGANQQAMGYEASDMATAIETGANPTAAWTQETMAIMTAMREQWGLVYPNEK
ncbi:Gfo/Idh/MocA family protein [Lapidilactobacillus wuchangensis]|uniref:Gfo/Idh/MocA family protein n=1 Tax=Lapidilactobacillus wuchangensis TaxID=2486001 RepID=UPI000F7B9C71|nr:Gfo/Idh/MocA family oxidoreductase [Lapidilactobacillus wuchangensis]